MKPTTIRAVLFDYDGVVADSMGDNFRAWEYAFQQCKVKLTEDVFLPLEGMSPEGIAASLGKLFGLSSDTYSAVAIAKDAYYQDHYTFKTFPQVESVIRDLREKHIKTALVTGSRNERLTKTTPKEIISLFDVIITSDMVARPKPDPEPYQKALMKLKVEAKDAIVVENAPMGVTSAKAAGIYCVAIATGLSCEFLRKADACITDLNLLRDMIALKKMDV